MAPPFDGYYFIDLDSKKTDYLKSICRGRTDATIFTGDCNQILKETLLPQIRFENFKRALCLLDPYGLHLEWEVLKGISPVAWQHVNLFGRFEFSKRGKVDLAALVKVFDEPECWSRITQPNLQED